MPPAPWRGTNRHKHRLGDQACWLWTYQRHQDALNRKLSVEQSGRTWKFAEILGRATDLLGSQAEAEAWLERPAMALDQRRPLDLMSMPPGVQILEELLTRLEHGA